MKKSMKLIAIVCISLLLFSQLFGCQKNENTAGSESTAQSESSKAQTTAELKNIEMRFSWWGGDSRHKAMLDAIDLYQQNNPNVKIEAEYSGFDGYNQKMTMQLSSGTAPDLLQVSYAMISTLTRKGFVADLNQYKDIIDLSTFNKPIMDGYNIFDNKLGGLSMGINTYALLCNETLLKDNGIPVDMEWTWETLLEEGKKLHAKNPAYYFLNVDAGGTEYFIIRPYLEQLTGKQWLDEAGNLGFDKASLIQAYEYLSKLFAEGLIQPFGNTVSYAGKVEQDPKWINGEIAFAPLNAATIIPFKAISKFPLAIGKYPMMKDAKSLGIALSSSNIISISNASTSKEEAAKFINWLLNTKEAALKMGNAQGVPNSNIARDTLVAENQLDPLVAQALDFASQNAGKPLNVNFDGAQIEEICKGVIEELAYNKLTPDQAAEKLLQQLKENIEQQKKAQ